MSVTIPSLDPVTDILDTDKIMVTQSSGQTYTIDGASFNKRNQAVIANSTTLTGAPLKTGNIVRVYFTADITGVNTTTGLVLNYNGTNKNVKVPKDGALANFTAQNMGGSPTVYKYLQAYTTLELLYDGTNFVIIGNPVVISGTDFAYYADGKVTKSFNKTVSVGSSATTNTYPNYYIKIGGINTNYTSGTNVITFLIGTRYNRYILSINPWYTSGEYAQLISLTDGTRNRIKDIAWEMSSTSEPGTMDVWLKIECNGFASKIFISDISQVQNTYTFEDIGNDNASYGETTAAAYFNNLDLGTKRELRFITPSFNIPRGGTFITNYIYKQAINENFAIYFGSATIGSDASGGNLFLQVDGLDFRNNDIINGEWYVDGTSYNGSLLMTSNTSIWTRKGLGGSDSLTTSEAAGKTIIFKIIARTSTN